MTDQKKDVLRPTDGDAIRLARRLLRASRFGSLAVLEPETGAPSASRVATATDPDGSPLILVSTLSSHTGGLIADPRCSLLLGEPGKGDPLAHPRITIACVAEKLDRESEDGKRARRRFLNRHPKAELYVDFGDFSFFRLAPQRASLNGGFGKAYALTRSDLLVSGTAIDEIAAAEQGAISHMNSDHRDAIELYARHFAKAKPGDWIMTGLDVDGFDLACGDDSRRVFFPEPLTGVAAMRKTLVSMARTARESE
ncbi:HugZ family protein [Aquibium carbonis]|uniref:HugZ family protein n=1 Tax=Aquibium carbonis TaxID=2495581 RepID=A0A429YXA9_9HYPH|nr:HugZ family protein [Aquibium carbonis]RST86082.1 HugZ family protein [Aquibium carbonis]